MCDSFYHPFHYSNSMQQDSRLQSANTLDLLVAVFPRKVVSFSLSPLLYPLRTSIITFFWLILKSGPSRLRRSLAPSRVARFARPNIRACSQAKWKHNVRLPDASFDLHFCLTSSKILLASNIFAL